MFINLKGEVMKYLVLVLVSLFTVGALACPNLTGKYLCVLTYEDGSSEEMTREITQEIQNEITVYTVKETYPAFVTEYIAHADGKDYNYFGETEDGTFINVTENLACNENILNYKYKGVETDKNNKELFSADMLDTISLGVSKNLVTHTTGTLVQDGQTHTIDEIETCRAID